jgi:alkanesulfonate monooxygenase SsuD/methylene tetrahydromethanopterin reductase-like flavin-dependent oxidoreductase (luciferase family)
MTDYGHHLEFGYFLVTDAHDPEGIQTGRLADSLGYELVAVEDRPYQPGHLDTLALFGAILAQTERIRVLRDVCNLPLRRPAVFAKAAATLDLLSSWRFEAGLGGGGFLQAARAMGATVTTPGAGVDTLEEAPIEIWRGAPKPRTLALIGREADAWAAPLINYLPPAQAARTQAIIDGAAGEAGRKPAAIRRIYNVGGAFTDAPDIGLATFILTREADPQALGTLIDGVAPAVRKRVAAARAESAEHDVPPADGATQ